MGLAAAPAGALRSAPTNGEGASEGPLSIRDVPPSYFSVASEPSLGAPVPDEPMNSLRPSGKVTSRPLALQAGRPTGRVALPVFQKLAYAAIGKG